MTNFRKIAVAVSTAAMFFGVLPQALAGSVFSDVADTNEFAVYIHDLQAQGIVSGVGTTGMYMPERNVSRGEMMKMVINAMKKSGEGKSALTEILNTAALPGAPHFEDVSAGSSFYTQVEMAYALGIVNGRRAPAEGVQGSFGVNEPVLRQEAMKMVVGAYRKVAEATFVKDLTGGPSFDDVSASSEFYDYIQTAYNLTIVNGYGNSKFGPMDPMRRDQMAKVISNSMKVFTTGKPLSVGVPARVQVDNSDPQIKNDGTSTATITCTVVDRNGNRVGDWTDPLSFTTDAGTLSIVGGSEAAATTKSVSSDKGRGIITLISSTVAGTATVTCRTGSMEGTTKVEFTADAPGVRNGFGSAAIAGVGELHVRATDNHIVASRQDAPSGSTIGAGSTSVTPVSGFATIESFVYDDAGDPSCGDTLVYSIKSGNGSLETTTPTGAASTAVRSLTLSSASSCLNGRYVAYLNILATQNSGNVVVQVLDRSTSPSLMTTVNVQIDLVKLEAKVYDSSILTRNSAQISASTATEQNIAPVIIKTLDENNRPFRTAHTAATVDQVECRLLSGATASALLDGVSVSNAAARIRNTTVQADYIDGSAGLYAVNVIAGSASGSLVVECRDLDAIGQPSVRFTVTVRAPQVELFVSSARARASTLTTVIGRIRDGSKPVTGEELRLQLDGGDSRVDVGGTYTYAGAALNSATMDHICYVRETQPTVVGDTSSNLLLPVSIPTLGQVTIRPFGEDCGATESDSGWYTAKVYMPLSVTERDQTIGIRATDLSRAEQPQGNVTVVATRGLPSEARQLTVMPMAQEVGINQDIPTVIFVQDARGFGLSCTASGALATGNANGETAADAQSGCTTARNGIDPDSSSSIGINRLSGVTGLNGYLSVNPTSSENVFVYTRGTGATDTSQYFIVNNLGGGAYFMVARAKDRADRAEWRVELNDSSGVELQAPLVQVNIVPNRITTEFSLATTIPDWNNTLIAFVRDQNNDPVTGLTNCRNNTGGAFPTNSFNSFAVTRSGSDVADINAQTNVGVSASTGAACTGTDVLHDASATPSAAAIGSGLYLFNVDTINSAPVGTVSVKVSLNQATNPESTASYRIQDPSVTFDAWPNRLSSSNVVPLTVIVRDDQGTPLTISLLELVQTEIVRGSGNLAATNATSPAAGLRVNLTNTTDGVFVGSYKASSVTEGIDLVARLNAISSRAERHLSVSVN